MGGAETSLCTLVGGERRHRHAVVSLTGFGFHGPRIEALGVRVHALAMPRGAVTLAGLAKLRRLVAEHRPRVVQGWMYHGNLAASLAQRLAGGAPVLAWNLRTSLDALPDQPARTRAVVGLGRRLSGRAEAIVYNSATGRRQHEDYGYAADRGEVIPNGFDTSLWRPDASARAALRHEWRIPEEAIVAGFVGRFHRIKDLPTYLAALARVMARHPDLHAVLVGDGDRDATDTLAPALAALPMDRVRLPGLRADIPRCMAVFDVLGLSSRAESFPNVLGEAMACGVPCVSTDAGDAAVIVGDTGRIVAPRDSSALAAALDEIVSLDPAARRALGARARQRIERSFGLDTTLRRYEALYDRLMTD